MRVAMVTQRLREWVIGSFIKAINNVSKEEDRLDVIEWLTLSRDVVGSDKPTKTKFVELYSLLNTRKAVRIALNGVVEGVRNYKRADLPLAAKVAVPVTLLAAPFLGGHGVGLAALGGAVGLPALLLIFVGTAGITSIIEACAQNDVARGCISGVAALIVKDEIKRQTSAALKKAMREERSKATRAEMPEDEAGLRQRLLSMDPFDFEKHVMSFFEAAGMEAWPTKKSNDLGVDGFAQHPDGVIVVQCKRYSLDNLVGSPAVQQFKGVIEENGALKGYFITTSGFSSAAQKSAEASDKITLVEMDELVRWHAIAPSLM
jgi:hypothetical protein